jgi:hypothetical protein
LENAIIVFIANHRSAISKTIIQNARLDVYIALEWDQSFRVKELRNLKENVKNVKKYLIINYATNVTLRRNSAMSQRNAIHAVLFIVLKILKR